MDTDTQNQTSSKNPTTTRVFVSSLCKKIAKELELPKEIVYEVSRAIPIHIIEAIKQKKSVVFENLGVFSPHIMQSNFPGTLPTYKIRFKTAPNFKGAMRQIARHEDRQKPTKRIKQNLPQSRGSTDPTVKD